MPKNIQQRFKALKVLYVSILIKNIFNPNFYQILNSNIISIKQDREKQLELEEETLYRTLEKNYEQKFQELYN